MSWLPDATTTLQQSKRPMYTQLRVSKRRSRKKGGRGLNRCQGRSPSIPKRLFHARSSLEYSRMSSDRASATGAGDFRRRWGLSSPDLTWLT
ncbi:hypothetical protein BaRGS_00005725 [Batillaria attramentaria]|uniref:Uncharacterized protein n=1 Tax=Batillaria attramentaria TaxID=370345 RepID=A0ABD0LU40_9CAEN